MILISESAKEKSERERFFSKVNLSEPAPAQSETATNAPHQHQPAPAPKDWKAKVSEVLKRLVHNHPSR